MKTFDGKFSRFDTIHQRDRRTDNRTTAKTALCFHTWCNPSPLQRLPPATVVAMVSAIGL